MRQVFPEPAEIGDVLELLAGDDRTPPPGRPWLMANMIASVDGAYAVDGRSGPLGGPADRLVFHSLRAISDVVLAAAGTVRTERYRRPAADPTAAEVRRRRHQAPAPRLAVVSRSLRLPADLPLLHGEGPDPVVLHPAGADTSAVPDGVELRAVGTGDVDLAEALAGLGRDGASWVICEGGPGLLGQLHDADLLDELFLTVSPMLVGGPRTGLLDGAAAVVHDLELHRVLESDGFLLLTYRRRRLH